MRYPFIFLRRYHIVVTALLPFIMVIVVLALSFFGELISVPVQTVPVQPAVVQDVSSDQKPPVLGPDFGENSEKGQNCGKELLDKTD